jgi:hypothetical protein
MPQTIFFVLFITPRHGPLHLKHILSIVEEACLPRRCMATVAAQTTAVLLLHAFMLLALHFRVTD